MPETMRRFICRLWGHRWRDLRSWSAHPFYRCRTCGDYTKEK